MILVSQVPICQLPWRWCRWMLQQTTAQVGPRPTRTPPCNAAHGLRPPNKIFKVVEMPWCLSQNGAPGTSIKSDQLVTCNMNVYFNKFQSLLPHPTTHHFNMLLSRMRWSVDIPQLMYHHPECQILMHPGWHSPSPLMTQLSRTKSSKMNYPKWSRLPRPSVL